MSRVGEVLLRERLDDIHVKAFRVFFTLHVPIAGLFQHMDLLLEPKVFHIETLKLSLYLVKQGVEMGFVCMWKHTVPAASPE